MLDEGHVDFNCNRLPTFSKNNECCFETECVMQFDGKNNSYIP